MLEMPKLIRAWKSVSTKSLHLFIPVIIANLGKNNRSGRGTGQSSRNKQSDAETSLFYPGEPVHTPCNSMYNNEKRNIWIHSVSLFIATYLPWSIANFEYQKLNNIT